MNIDWEAILPVLFFILYGVAQALSSRKNKGEETEQDPFGPDAQPRREDDHERARRIREEVQRRIAERREEERRAKLDPPETIREMGETRRALARRYRQGTPASPAAPIPVPSGPANDLFERLQREQERLAAARSQREEISRQTISRTAIGTGRSRPAPVPSLQPALQAQLQNPEALRQAFILTEILGKPVALRGTQGHDPF